MRPTLFVVAALLACAVGVANGQCVLSACCSLLSASYTGPLTDVAVCSVTGAVYYMSSMCVCHLAGTASWVQVCPWLGRRDEEAGMLRLNATRIEGDHMVEMHNVGDIDAAGRMEDDHAKGEGRHVVVTAPPQVTEDMRLPEPINSCPHEGQEHENEAMLHFKDHRRDGEANEQAPGILAIGAMTGPAVPSMQYAQVAYPAKVTHTTDEKVMKDPDCDKGCDMLTIELDGRSSKWYSHSAKKCSTTDNAFANAAFDSNADMVTPPISCPTGQCNVLPPAGKNTHRPNMTTQCLDADSICLAWAKQKGVDTKYEDITGMALPQPSGLIVCVLKDCDGRDGQPKVHRADLKAIRGY